MIDTHWTDEEISIDVSPNDLTSALCDLQDVRNALSERIKNRPKDSEGTEITIGDCLDDVIYFLQKLETEMERETANG
jgi:NTP pyrophosphatase (non-canonical NTP hydrolase)